MASRRTCIHSHGYTLIELLIVVGLVLMLIAIALFTDLHNYLGDAFRGERRMLVTVLQTARADALNNVDQASHGVALHPADHPQDYVTFEGDDYDASDPSSRRVFIATYPTDIDPSSPSEIVFCQLSGDATRGVAAGTACEDHANAFEGDITLVDRIRRLTLAVSIDSEGAISW
jgi:prepilin-type N-terminal cleavage/methylation domain-containing protein